MGCNADLGHSRRQITSATPVTRLGIGHLAGRWIEARGGGANFGALLGGDLLVLATVIAAAGIGDLIFDIRRGTRQLGQASAIAGLFALLVIVGSVLLYGFVISRQVTAGLWGDSAQSNTPTETTRASILVQQATSASTQIATLTTQLEEATGAGPSGSAAQASVASNLQRRIAALQLVQAQDLGQASSLYQQASDSLVSFSSRNQHEELQDAKASVVMFALGLIAGAWCIWAETKGDTEDVTTNRRLSALDSNA